MDSQDKLLDELKCGLCQEYLSYPPITLYAETGSVCGRCPVLDSENNANGIHEKNYEKVAKLLMFPCRYQSQGCDRKLRIDEVPLHEESCEYKLYFCPRLPLGSCPWIGEQRELHIHFASEHQDLLLESPVFEINLIDDYKENYLFPDQDELFVVHTECSQESKIFSCSVHHFGKYSSNRGDITYLYTLNLRSLNAGGFINVPGKIVSNSLSVEENDNNCYKVDLETLQNDLNQPTSVLCTVGVEAAPVLENFNTPGIEIIDTELEEEPLEEENPSFEERPVSKMLIDMECPVCQEYMIPPIYQCLEGHSICEVCKPKVRECPICRGQMGQARNYTLEKITENIQYTCRYSHYGCYFTCSSKDIRDHEANCKYQPRICLFPSCQWKGKFSKIIWHVKHSHENLIQKQSFTLTFDDNDSIDKRTFLEANREPFQVRYYHTANEYQFMMTVLYLGDPENTGNFMYELRIVDLKRSGSEKYELMSKKKCGDGSDTTFDLKHATIWTVSMLKPFMNEENELTIEIKVKKMQ